MVLLYAGVVTHLFSFEGIHYGAIRAYPDDVISSEIGISMSGAGLALLWKGIADSSQSHRETDNWARCEPSPRRKQVLIDCYLQGLIGRRLS